MREEIREFPHAATEMELFHIGTDRDRGFFACADSDPGAVQGEHVLNRHTACLNLGAGRKQIGDSVRLDLPWRGAHVEWDADTEPLDYRDSSIGRIYAIHFLEHVADPIAVLAECQRVLVTGGVLNIVVPYFRSQGAFHDLTHKHFFTEDTWKNTFANLYYPKFPGEAAVARVGVFAWRFRVNTNLVIGYNDRNLMLVTQLEKTASV